jgi:hypothetical protein
LNCVALRVNCVALKSLNCVALRVNCVALKSLGFNLSCVALKSLEFRVEHLSCVGNTTQVCGVLADDSQRCVCYNITFKRVCWQHN